MKALVSVLIIAGCAAIVVAYPSSVPPTASVCKQMTPGHGSKALSTPSECLLNVSTASVKHGHAVTVTLSAIEGSSFKGYYIQARNTEGAPIGSFATTELTKAHSCGGIKNNAAHHGDNKPKTSVPIIWKSPKDYVGTVVFTATCVKDFSNYWVGLKSDPLKLEA